MRRGKIALNDAQRHWALVVATTLVATLLCGAGLGYEASRSRALHTWVQDRLAPTTRLAVQLLESLRLRAALAAAQDRLGTPVAFDTELPDVELTFFERTAEGYRPLAVAGRSSAYSEGESTLPLQLVTERAGARFILWPSAAPKRIAHCARAQGERIACASLPLDSFLTLAAGASALGVRYELSRPGLSAPIAHTPRWEDGDPSYEATTTFKLDHEPFSLTGRAGAVLKQSYGMADGRYFAIGSFAVFLAAIAALFARRRGMLRQLALQEAVSRTRSAGEDLVRATLRKTAYGAGVLVWLLHADERLELIGPWLEHTGLEEGQTTLEKSLNGVADKDEVRQGLLEAMRSRSPWSRILALDLDGAALTLQATCAPVVDAGGRFVAMLGVSADITQALKTQSQVMHDEAYRKAQAAYLGHMARELSGPAMHMQAVVDRLGRQLDVRALDADTARLLSLASTEAKRLFEFVRASSQLMQLRSTSTREALAPQRIDDLARDVAMGVASREGRPRGQELAFEGAAGRDVLTHRESLMTILDIVLTNAFRYSPDSSELAVRLHEEASALHIDVEDAGPGMTDKELARLGEPFFRGAASIGIQGSGLGVATAFELARHSKASIRFQRSAKPGRGLLVTISVPWA